MTASPNPPSPEEPMLYHYTSIDAFKKIMTRRPDHLCTMRATAYDQMNDHSEVVFAQKLLVNAAKKCESISDACRQYFIKGVMEEEPMYILSFSEVSDSLPIWRSYAPSGGVCTGITPRSRFFTEYHRGDYCAPNYARVYHTKDSTIKRLDQMTIAESSEAQLLSSTYGASAIKWARKYRCSYLDPSDTAAVEKLIMELSSHIASDFAPYYSHIASTDNSPRSEIATFRHRFNILNNLYAKIPTLKHSAYKYEAENRFVVDLTHINSIECTALDERNRKFVTCLFDPDKTVLTVQPSPHGDIETIERVLRFVKEREGHTYKILDKSTIPYRMI